ncbi:MAG: hypothetical protein ACQEXJ_07895 [Myxococcota bacterium]
MATRSELDQRLTGTLDRLGIVGERFRTDLLHDLKAKVLLREARDTVEVRGPSGSGRHTVARAAHAACRDLLGRSGARVDVDCARAAQDVGLGETLTRSLREAATGTLVLDRTDALSAPDRELVGRALRESPAETLVVALGEDAAPGATRIDVKPLHEREDDIWQLVEHFWEATAAECDVAGCRGFSRQAKADIAAAIRETGLGSVRRLREVVRDLVFGALAEGAPPLKLTSERVRPYLETRFGQTAGDREERDVALVDSRFAALPDDSLLARLARTHGVPERVLSRQAEVIHDVITSIDDVPPSYRNIMDRADDIMRASLWLLSGATTQAEFRRYFGSERFMRPTKSVAWAFYNRVFKRET